MALQVPRFFDSYFQLSRQTNQEHWALQRFDKRSRGKKTRCFETIVHNFSAHVPHSNEDHFFTRLLPAHPDSRRREIGPNCLTAPKFHFLFVTIFAAGL